MRAFRILILFKYNDRIAWAIFFKFQFSSSSKLRFRSVWIPRYLKHFCVAVTISAESFASAFNQVISSFLLIFRDWLLPTLWTHTDAGLSDKSVFSRAHYTNLKLTKQRLSFNDKKLFSKFITSQSKLVFDVMSDSELFCLSVLMKTQIPVKFFRYFMSGNVNEIWLETFLLN